MGKFATPQWDSNTVGDEICNTLFEGKYKGKTKSKEKLKNGGRVVKAKLKKAKQQINGKFVNNIKDNINQMKNIVSKKKNIVSKKKNNINKQNLPKAGDSPNSSNKKGKESSRRKIIMKKIKQPPKLKNLPNLKHVKNMLKTQLSSGGDDQKILFSEDGDHTMSEQDTSKNKVKKKREKKKLGNLKKDMAKKIKSDILEVKNLIKQKRNKSEWNVSHDIIDTEDCNLNKSLESNFVDKTPPQKKDQKGSKSLSLRERMLGKLKASRFRYLNEQLYCSPSREAQKLFKGDPDSFNAYHEGFRQQVDRWPINPVDIIIRSIKKMNKNHVIVDFGCGDAKIAQEVKQKVHSFDLAATNDRVTACDMANVPLTKESVDVAVFCLSLMGTNLQDYLKEANRVLKIGGILKIAEVESRFNDVEEFVKGIQCFGFQNIHKDLSHNIFYFLDFKKITNTKKSKGLPVLILNPCLYKKR